MTVLATTDQSNNKDANKGASRTDSSHGIAVRALEQIDKLGLKPLPQLYELWFRYYQGDPEIVRAIDHHPGDLDEVNCHKIYKRYLSETARDDAVKKISDQVAGALGEIARMINSVQSATNDYSGTLTGVTEQIEKAETLEDLSVVVSAIVQDTKKMVEQNVELQMQLSTSSSQVSELRQNLDNVKKEAMTDGLTGLANRKAFDKQIRDAIEEAEDKKTSLTLLMLDIDHFKQFNDTYGHQVGDQVLRLVSRTLTDNVKGRDIAARYGGEEFAIVLPETGINAASRVAEHLRRMVETKEVVNKTNHESLGRITLSIGLAEYHAGESISDFIERADVALYQAKRRGRNRVEIAT